MKKLQQFSNPLLDVCSTRIERVSTQKILLQHLRPCKLKQKQGLNDCNRNCILDDYFRSCYKTDLFCLQVPYSKMPEMTKQDEEASSSTQQEQLEPLQTKSEVRSHCITSKNISVFFHICAKTSADVRRFHLFK